VSSASGAASAVNAQALGAVPAGCRVEDSMGERFLPAAPGALAAPLVHQASSDNCHQPAVGVIRKAILRPSKGRFQQCFLDGVLAGIELAVAAGFPGP
jgi:hypothetical protein